MPGLRYEGLYGLEDAAPELTYALVPRVERAAAAVPEAWVEDKGVSVAVHYRQAPDPDAARRALVVALEPVAADAGMRLIEGKMVLELVPPDRPMKGGAVRAASSASRALEAVLYAGDDLADLDAFAALDRPRGEGRSTRQGRRARRGDPGRARSTTRRSHRRRARRARRAAARSLA